MRATALYIVKCVENSTGSVGEAMKDRGGPDQARRSTVLQRVVAANDLLDLIRHRPAATLMTTIPTRMLQGESEGLLVFDLPRDYSALENVTPAS